MKFKPAHFSYSAYTLIEVLIVIGMIAAISAITITIVNPSKQRDRVSDAVLKESVEKVAAALEVYKSVYGDYPYDQTTAENMSRYIGEGYTVYIADGIIAFNNTALDTGNQASSVYWDYANQCLQAQSSEDPTQYINWIPGGNVDTGTNCGDEALATTITDDTGPTGGAGGTTVVYTPPGASGGGGGAGGGTGGVTPALIANYKLDEESGIIVSDSTINHYNGSLINGPEWIDGVSGTAVDFMGSNQHARISGLLGRPASITITAWVNIKVTPSGYGYEVFSVGDIAAIRVRPSDIYGFYYSYTTGGEPSWLKTQGSPSIIGAGWTHLAYTVNTVDYEQKLYVNGNLRATTSHAQSIRYSDLGTGTYIGKHGDGSALYDLNGAVDNVKVYNYALTQDQVNEDMEFSPPLVPEVRFKFEEIDVDTAQDWSGNRNYGNLGGSANCPGDASCPISAIGHSGNAFDFDGSNDYVDVGNKSGTILSDPTGSSITWAAWIAPDDITTVSSYALTSGAQTSSRGIAINFNSSEQVFCYFKNATESANATGTVLPIGIFSHVACVFDKDTHILKMYINGELADSVSSTGGSYSDTYTSFMIGRPTNVSNYYFNGRIDNVEIFDSALTQPQVQSEMNK